jgi:ElaB/YqjD/DUF883 family membrane-anchored ribosome-binding protein
MVADGDNVVVITIKDVYDTMVAQGKVLESVHSRLDKVTMKHESHDQWFDDHEQRLRDLEKFRWQAAGIASVVGSIVGVIVSRL